ncbi:hypothetical protein ACN4DJ_05920 [Corynebacterium macclintockiae]|uniref:Uncharacterized protein n=1 Tax=Corynebacterium urealyticum TaxID=43771 RepID=A0A2W5B1F8_9CORY|nr:MAG: hypothetical protein DI609_10540 [Corynebacterium urealyticum]
MSRHDETPITSRVIPPSHPTVQGAQRRLISEIDEWLDEDDAYTDDAVPYQLNDEQQVDLFDMIAASLAAITIAGTILLLAWHLGKLLI